MPSFARSARGRLYRQSLLLLRLTEGEIMFRKTVKNQKRLGKSWVDHSSVFNEKHTDKILIETWWFLFIPLYSRQTLLSSDL
jgi:hypothetical protein